MFKDAAMKWWMDVEHLSRHNLDIVSQKEWYDRYGVEKWMIIVLRDPDMSIAALSHSHCKSMERLLEENKRGRM